MCSINLDEMSLSSKTSPNIEYYNSLQTGVEVMIWVTVVWLLRISLNETSIDSSAEIELDYRWFCQPLVTLIYLCLPL